MSYIMIIQFIHITQMHSRIQTYSCVFWHAQTRQYAHDKNAQKHPPPDKVWQLSVSLLNTTRANLHKTPRISTTPFSGSSRLVTGKVCSTMAFFFSAISLSEVSVIVRHRRQKIHVCKALSQHKATSCHGKLESHDDFAKI